MKIAKHQACGYEVTVKRVRIDREEAESVIWCARCNRIVSEEDLNIVGPLCVVKETA